EIVASGQDVRGRGGADLRLTSSLREKGPGQTEVTAVSQVNITGLLAQMGRGMVQDVSDQMFGIFSQRLRAELEGASVAAPTPSSAAAAPAASDPAASSPTASATAGAAARPAEALDVGALGARVAGRAALRGLRTPVPLWAVVVALLLLYLVMR
ncbi:MAG TPA: hypothetical protein VEP68_06935, partial [Anaeromyxobacteraceae bacterium]|nr:hypothetical protein [Anaeromyxobacteraceae bacterium]